MSQRLCIYPDDVERITEEVYGSAGNPEGDSRQASKIENQMVSYCELAAHLGLALNWCTTPSIACR